MTTTTIQGAVGYAALWVADVERAAAFFGRVLGWSYTDTGGRHRMIHGVSLPQAIVPLDALPAGVWDSWPRHNTAFLSHGVADVDLAVRRVRDLGGHAAEPSEQPHGRTAGCVDDQGMPFSIHEATPERTPTYGQLAYLTFEVADSTRAKAFCGSLFGWSFEQGSHTDGWQIDGLRPRGGVSGGHDTSTVVPMYAVDDIESSIVRARDAGGAATDAEPKPFGFMSTCVDPQGTHFHLGQLG